MNGIEREIRLRACAGEIRHGLEMLRHWQGRQPAASAWMAHVERYSQRLSELVADRQPEASGEAGTVTRPAGSEETTT